MHSGDNLNLLQMLYTASSNVEWTTLGWSFLLI
jgi:hypothetical protein